MEGFDGSSSAPNVGKKNYHNDSKHFTCVLVREDGGVLSQPILRQEGDARLTGASSKEGKRVESPPMFI